MLRVVADANVLVSAALARSPQAPSALTLDAALDSRLELVTAPHLLQEIAAVLARPRLQKCITTAEALRFVTDLAAQTKLIADAPGPHPAVCRDPHDDYLVALATTSGADALVTGDRDLLALDPQQLAIEIIAAGGCPAAGHVPAARRRDRCAGPGSPSSSCSPATRPAAKNHLPRRQERRLRTPIRPVRRPRRRAQLLGRDTLHDALVVSQGRHHGDQQPGGASSGAVAEHRLEQLRVDLALPPRPVSANASATVLARPRPRAASSRTTRPRRSSPSRASRNRLLANPARPATAGVPGRARFSRSAKLASENATSRSPQDRSSRASATAIVSRLIGAASETVSTGQ